MWSSGSLLFLQVAAVDHGLTLGLLFFAVPRLPDKFTGLCIEGSQDTHAAVKEDLSGARSRGVVGVARLGPIVVVESVRKNLFPECLARIGVHTQDHVIGLDAPQIKELFFIETLTNQFRVSEELFRHNTWIVVVRDIR